MSDHGSPSLHRFTALPRRQPRVPDPACYGDDPGNAVVIAFSADRGAARPPIVSPTPRPAVRCRPVGCRSIRRATRPRGPSTTPRPRGSTTRPCRCAMCAFPDPMCRPGSGRRRAGRSVEARAILSSERTCCGAVQLTPTATTSRAGCRQGDRLGERLAGGGRGAVATRCTRSSRRRRSRRAAGRARAPRGRSGSSRRRAGPRRPRRARRSAAGGTPRSAASPGS